jgi:hypothetical protein
MDYSDTLWVKQHVTQQLEWLAGLIGGEVGDCDRRERLAMEKYVAEHIERLGGLIARDSEKLKALVQSQSKTIEAQGRQIKALEAKLTRPKVEKAEAEYRPTMRRDHSLGLS